MTTNFITLNEVRQQNLDTSHFPAEAQFIVRLLNKLERGSLHMQFPDGQSASFGQGLPAASLHLRNWNIFNTVLKSGDIGFAETYIDGHWTSNNLPGLIELISYNRQHLEDIIYGTWWGSLLYRAKHLLNRNSRKGSKKNIHAHYDIGNDFYKLWLDPTMTYSSALFSTGHVDNLQDAQVNKYRRILDELHVDFGSRILEIGCGWGGFAEIAASEAGAHVTGLTLSTEQLEFAEQRMARAGLLQHSQLRLQDYRDVKGEYDAIASIEMFEAVGEKYWPSYFDCIHRNLKKGGRACIQSIVIADDLFDRYRKGTDFIQQYIFPGGMLPSIEVFKKYAEKHGLQVVETLSFGMDYARTLQEWRAAFMEKLHAIKDQGFDEKFLRTWEFYLAYCEAGFLAKSISVAQFTLVKK
ncbi:SAM-dependent methyltransferase [Undibacterium terreum]|uniref:Cyclopropane-fatty-acyl-phospholipid synthase n=1 Tax=Undibacterium terreum TaxID=1224302 RepID=A0A916UUK4_9BURK|nr:cyclopropane-fatty-acyl-phospholipid synthase family protein [Undibacterium terreum]GGC88507.1 cyclopropane-fatty-acyl-phospholipid synthase [Undibacterium terreum]